MKFGKFVEFSQIITNIIKKFKIHITFYKPRNL